MQVRHVSWAVAALLLVASPSFAQEGAITGKVTHQITGVPLEGINVSAYTRDGTFVQVAVTGPDGVYTLYSLPSRFYYLGAGLAISYKPEAYGCSGCAITDSVPVPVAPGLTTTGIDFALAPPASVTGRVTDSATGVPMAGVAVWARAAIDAKSALTDANGVYNVTGLRAGVYSVYTDSWSGHVNEVFDNVPCNQICTSTSGVPVVLTAGATTTQIDFALSLPSPPGVVEGTVRDALSNAPVASVLVTISNATTQVASAFTDGSGAYSATVPPGSYVALATPSGSAGYARELFHDLLCEPTCTLSSGTPVVVASGATTTNVDFTLERGGTITGNVSGGSLATPLAGVAITAYAANGTFAGSATTNGLGVYAMTVKSGTYTVRTTLYDAQAYRDEMYNNIPCVPACEAPMGTPVVVTSNATVSGINFTLDALWNIVGTVSSTTTGSPIANVTVQAYSSTGALMTSTMTSASGAYLLRVPAGQYYLRTWTQLPVPYRNELFNNIPCPDNCVVVHGTPVTVTAGTTAVADFGLDPGGAISGIATNATTSAPLTNIRVDAYTPGGVIARTSYTDENGMYTLLLPANVYRVRASGFLLPFADELYNDVPCTPVCAPATGSPVTVLSGATTAGVNFALTPTGTITGSVTDAITSGWLQGATVTAYAVDGTAIGSVETGFFGFTLSLPAGAYYLRAQGPAGLNYVGELYSDLPCSPSCNVTKGIPITVTSGIITSGVSIGLSPGGMVSGRVLDASNGEPIAAVTVELLSAAGTPVATAVSSQSGAFTFAGVKTGSYRVRSVNGWSQNYVDTLFANIPCAGCVVTAGTGVAVTAGAATSGVDLLLERGGSLSGTITNAATGAAPQSIVPVRIYDASGVMIRSTFLEGGGHFSVRGLLTGSYFVRTAATEAFINEWYGYVPCVDTCEVPSGTPVAVIAGSDTPGVNIALAPGGTITGTVTDAATGNPIAGDFGDAQVRVFAPDGRPVGQGDVDQNGIYVVSGLPTGSYFLRTSSTGGYIDERYDNAPCLLTCDVTAGTAVPVVAGATVSGINFSLAPGGRVAGHVTDDTTAAPLSGVLVRILGSDGAAVATARSDWMGTFLSDQGLPAGAYYARTLDVTGHVDEWFADTPLCAATCLPTGGTLIAVNAGLTTPGVDFALAPMVELIQNGSFDDGVANWLVFATPSIAYMPWRIPADAFEFARVAPPAGTTNQAVVFQNTGAALPANAPLVAQFDLGNTSPVRKRISVLLLDHDFGDLSVCTFWLPANLPLTRFGIRTRTTRAWTNASIYFYAASTNVPAGFYQIDNVSLRAPASLVVERTDCIDPTAPPATGGGPGPDLLINGDFSSGAVEPGWSTFGQIQSQVSAGIFDFVKLAGAPAGVLLQATGQALVANAVLTSTFSLGNSSSARKRVTVLIHDNDFSDLAACTFWLAPGQTLSSYTMRTFTTKAWTNATLSIYPATVGPEQWIRLDNVTLAPTPGTAIAGAECVEPSGAFDAVDSVPLRRATTAITPVAGDTVAPLLNPDAGGGDSLAELALDETDLIGDWRGNGFTLSGDPAPQSVEPSWIAVGGETASSTLTRHTPIDLTSSIGRTVLFDSWLAAPADVRAELQVSTDNGVSWDAIWRAETSDGWIPVEVDLTNYEGLSLRLRFLLESEGVAPRDAAVAPTWRLHVGAVPSR